MGLNVSEVLARMRVYVNEYAPTVADEFSMETEDDMLAHIDAAARMVAQVAPAHMQVAKTVQLNLQESERPDGMMYGMDALPADYMRIIYLVVDGLFKALTYMLPTIHPTFAMQFSNISGLGSGPYAPAAYLVDGSVQVHSWPKGTTPSSHQPNHTEAVDEGETTTDLDGYNANEQIGELTDEEEQPAVPTKNATLQYLALPKRTEVTVGTGQVSVYATLKEELKDVVAMQAAALFLATTDNDKAAMVQQVATTMLGELGKVDS